jgi:hypothetical protein
MPLSLSILYSLYLYFCRHVLVPFHGGFDKRILGKKEESIYHNQFEHILGQRNYQI